MRNLEINKSSFYFANFKDTEKVKDENDHFTGEIIVLYHKPVKIKKHISGAKGSSYNETFGTDINYDKTILFTKDEFKKLGITENTIFFLNVAPKKEGNTYKYDYIVSKIAETINQVVVAIKKVDN